MLTWGKKVSKTFKPLVYSCTKGYTDLSSFSGHMPFNTFRFWLLSFWKYNSSIFFFKIMCMSCIPICNSKNEGSSNIMCRYHLQYNSALCLCPSYSLSQNVWEMTNIMSIILSQFHIYNSLRSLHSQPRLAYDSSVSQGRSCDINSRNKPSHPVTDWRLPVFLE